MNTSPSMMKEKKASKLYFRMWQVVFWSRKIFSRVAWVPRKFWNQRKLEGKMNSSCRWSDQLV